MTKRQKRQNNITIAKTLVTKLQALKIAAADVAKYVEFVENQIDDVEFPDSAWEIGDEMEMMVGDVFDALTEQFADPEIIKFIAALEVK